MVDWIRCKDDLPLAGFDVVVHDTEEERCYVAVRESQSEIFWWVESNSDTEPTYHWHKDVDIWLPLPELPKEAN